MPWFQTNLSTRYIGFNVAEVQGGAYIDPSSFGASLAFVAPGVEPQTTDWVTAGWVQTQGGWAIQVLVGPAPAASIDLAVGNYVAWGMIDTGSEIWVNQLDTVNITGSNPQVPVLSVNELATYMGWPFGPEQFPAVAQVIRDLTGMLETLLKADLSIQTYTETYTVPGGPALWNDSVFGINTTEVWQDMTELPMAIQLAPVFVKHWPVISWDSLAIQVPAQQGPTVAQTTEAIAADVSIYQITCTPLSQALTSGGIVINDMGAPGGIGNTLQANTSGAALGASVIPLNAVLPLAPLVSGANIMLAAGTTWQSITPPNVPEDLPEFMPGTTVQVTYTAGFDGASMPDVKAAIKRAAARELTNRLDPAIGLHGGLAAVNLPDAPAGMMPGFTPTEIQPLKRYKKHVIV